MLYQASSTSQQSLSRLHLRPQPQVVGFTAAFARIKGNFFRVGRIAGSLALWGHWATGALFSSLFRLVRGKLRSSSGLCLCLGDKFCPVTPHRDLLRRPTRLQWLPSQWRLLMKNLGHSKLSRGVPAPTLRHSPSVFRDGNGGIGSQG